jgi:hypothetical protein
VQAAARVRDGGSCGGACDAAQLARGRTTKVTDSLFYYCFVRAEVPPAPAPSTESARAPRSSRWRLISSMNVEKKALDDAAHLVALLHQAEKQTNDSAWAQAADALVTHVHSQVEGHLSRKWQLAAQEALVVPALVAILSRRTAAPALKLQAAHALRLTVCTNESNQKAAAAAAPILLDIIASPSPAPAPSEGPKAAALARITAEQLRDAALEALAELVFMNKPLQDAAVAADAVMLLLPFISCAAPHNVNAAAQSRALRILANLTHGNVSPCAPPATTSLVSAALCAYDRSSLLQAEAARAAADAGAITAVVAAARARLAVAETKELAAAALVSLASHSAVTDAACAQGVLPLMVELLQAQPPASVAVPALQCACMLMYGRGDMCRLAAESGLLQTLHALRGLEYGEDFDALSSNAESALQMYSEMSV